MTSRLSGRVAFIEAARPTLGAGIPTVWNDVLSRVKSRGGDLGR